jgi:hypothetical protein
MPGASTKMQEWIEQGCQMLPIEKTGQNHIT